MNKLNSTLKYGKKLIKLTAKGIILTQCSLILASNIASIFSPKIDTQKNLEEKIEFERKKIDPNNKYKISGELVMHSEGRSRKFIDGTYKIELGGFFADETTLRHELYHILDHHFEDIENKNVIRHYLEYLFLHEPQAIIYELTELKL